MDAQVGEVLRRGPGYTAPSTLVGWRLVRSVDDQLQGGRPLTERPL